VGQRAQKAPRDASKEARKLENQTRLQNQSQKLGATRTKNTRYAAGVVKVDLIRVSLGLYPIDAQPQKLMSDYAFANPTLRIAWARGR
jgi:hypothetical protein